LNELVSVKYTIQKVVGLEEKKVPLGSEKILLFVQAEVLAGIDLSLLSPGDVKLLPGQSMHVTLPAPKIVHLVIDDKQTKVWDRQITPGTSSRKRSDREDRAGNGNSGSGPAKCGSEHQEPAGNLRHQSSDRRHH
jgi:hypothetical protein